MNETLEQTLKQVIEKSLALAEKTGQFVIDQAPDLIQQFFNWHTALNIYAIVLGVLIGIVIPLILYRSLGVKEEGEYRVKILNRWFEKYDNAPIFFIISIISWITSLSLIIAGIYWLLFITIAPKIYLIEYFITK